MNDFSTTKQYNYVALEWVKNEITQTLKQARQSLESFVENNTSNDLDFCLIFVHQVQSVLKVIELPEATNLTHEMEKLIEAIRNDKIVQGNKNEALEVLMQAIIQLPLYLEKIQEKRQENQILILALLNDLRTARGEDILTKTGEVAVSELPTIPALPDSKLSELNNPQFIGQLRKLRQMLQLALSNIIRGNQIVNNLEYLSKVFIKLTQICNNSPLGSLWEVSEALIAGLRNGEINDGASVRTLLRQIDQELKRLLDQGIIGINQKAPDSLIKNLLFYIGKAPGRSQQIIRIKQKYNLQDIALEEQLDANIIGATLDQDTLHTVATTLLEEINNIKDILDLFVRSARSNLEEIISIKPPLLKIADTLTILNFNDTRKLILEQITLLDDLSIGTYQVDDNLLLNIASALLQIENRINILLDKDNESSEMPTSDITQINTVVIREACLGIDRVKEIIVEYINSDWNTEFIAKIPCLIHDICGVIAMVPLPRATELLEQCNQYIITNLIEKQRNPSWEELDYLADSISAIEYYLEKLTTDYSNQDETSLDAALESLNLLKNLVTDIDDNSITKKDTTNSVSVLKLNESQNLDTNHNELSVSDINQNDENNELGILSESEQKIYSIDSGYNLDDFQLNSIENKIVSDASPTDNNHIIDGLTLSNEKQDVTPDLDLPGNVVTQKLSLDINDNLIAEMADDAYTAENVTEITLNASSVEVSKNTNNTTTEYESNLSIDHQIQQNTENTSQSTAINLGIPQLLPPPSDEDPVDEELREIFIEEAGEVLDTINTYLPKWIENNSDKNSLTEVRRAFHTLKGSGRMVRALVLGELAWSIENLLNRVIDKTINVSTELFDLIQQVVHLVPELCAEFAQLKQRHRNDVDFLAATAHAMSKDEELPKIDIDSSTEQNQLLSNFSEASNENITVNTEQSLKDDDTELELMWHDKSEQQELQDTTLNNAINNIGDVDYKLIGIFKTETEGYLNILQAFYNNFLTDLPHPVTNDLHRALHTLKGSASMADIAPILAVVKPLEKLAKFCKSHNIKWQKDEFDLLFIALQQMRQILTQISTGDMRLSNEAEEVIANLKNLLNKHETIVAGQRQSSCNELINPDVIKLFLVQGLDLLSQINNILNSSTLINWQKILDLLVNFKNKAHTTQQNAIVEACNILIKLYETIKTNNVLIDNSLLNELVKFNEELTNMLDQIATHWHASIDSEFINKIVNLTNQIIDQTQVKTIDVPAPIDANTLKDEPYKHVTDELTINLDWEAINLYLEDAQDALDNASSELELWLSEPDNTSSITLILGEVRILKSGARMAKLIYTLEVISNLESLYRGLRTKKYLQSELLASLLLRCHETLANHFDLLGKQQVPSNETKLLQDIKRFINGDNSPDGGNKSNPRLDPNFDITSTCSLTGDISANKDNIFNSSELENNFLNAKIKNEIKSEYTNVQSAEELSINETSTNTETNNSFIEKPEHDFNFTPQEDNQNHDKISDDSAKLLEEQENLKSADFSLSTDEQISLQTETNNLDDDFNGKFDDDLINMFVQDAQQLCTQIDKIINTWQQDITDLQPLKQASEILLGLKENAELSELTSLAEYSNKLAKIYDDCSNSKLFYCPALIEFLQKSNNLITDYLIRLTRKQDLPSFDNLLQELDSIYLEANKPYIHLNYAQTTEISIPSNNINENLEPLRYNSELLPTFLDEAQDVLENANNALQRWINQPDNIIELASLQRDLHTVKGGARMAEVNELATFAHELEYLYEALNDGRLQANEQLFDLLNACHDHLAVMLEQLQINRTIPNADSFINAVKSFRTDPNQFQAIPLSAAISDIKKPEEIPVDADLLDTFFDEAEELLAEFEKSLVNWDKDHNDISHIKNIMRILHTLKGSSRLAKLHNIGNASHELEQKINNAQNQNIDISTINEDIQLGYLNLCKLLEQAKKPVADLPVNQTTNDSPQSSTKNTVTPQEMIKIAVEKIDNLVNLAGETSIYRGRIEQQVSDFDSSLVEMEATIERVRDQLRRLDIETQAQILSSHKEEANSYDDFDPLELDRHSHLQQLSRSLFESASDLLDLTNTLHARSRDTKSLLIQQAQINTELQEGLMRTRMIAFTHIAPRLNRIVRQISRELGKKVEFKIINADNEIDRSVLERVIAPLEHMMRNAIDHGIEDVATRLKLGKPEVGQIQLELNREGGDIVLNLTDDGAGLNLDVIRRKAISLNLMNETDDLSDREIMRFILKAGFSTAQKVTQISGRGVGMDVAISEVKQIGGVIDINSILGKGTTFSIRLPFTLSVNRALMVYSGEDLYAIPLNTIEGIVRIAPNDLKKYYSSDVSRFEYAKQDYDLRYFGDLVQNGQHPKLIGDMPLPVILVRSREFAVAIQVDELAGSHEIVVKNLGKQFAELQGVSGATLLGDGRVVIILDLLAIIRSLHLHRTISKVVSKPIIEETSDNKQRQITAMVVDDSVTVRKVTTRLLERHGISVATAKDGVDAIAYLQDNKPDIMLLDIEMPRMDGFEVANIVRHDERLKDLPIIMITSRTGDKHRERAMSIGVNSYLGKPYQEEQLLQAIEQLVGIGS